MKLISSVILFIISEMCFSQITLIPDQGFEQALIDLNIDSDGVINGQVLTSDVNSVTDLILNLFNVNTIAITDLTGIEAFTNLEILTIVNSNISSLDVSNNLQLRVLVCRNNILTSLNLSANLNLEFLDISNDGDIEPFNDFTELDLSNNPNINSIQATNMLNLHTINLQNGNNNPNMNINTGFYYFEEINEPDFVYNNVCITVDNLEQAQNDLAPYNQWNVSEYYVGINYSNNCTLSIPKEEMGSEIELYPNPASEYVFIKTVTQQDIKSIVFYDIYGRQVLIIPDTNGKIDVSVLTAGSYIVKCIDVNNKAVSEKIVIR